MRTGRVTRLAEFGAFVELEPGVEGLAHASTFAPTGRSEAWSRSVPVGMTGAFEIVSIDLERKRIGVALVEEGSAEEVEDMREYTGQTGAAPAEGFGSLADKLRSALERREK